MTKETNLVTIRTYASEKGVTTATVYKWIELKRVRFTKIDGVLFIVKK